MHPSGKNRRPRELVKQSPRWFSTAHEEEVAWHRLPRRPNSEHRYTALSLSSLGQVWLVALDLVGARFMRKREVLIPSLLHEFSLSPPDEQGNQGANQEHHHDNRDHQRSAQCSHGLC